MEHINFQMTIQPWITFDHFYSLELMFHSLYKSLLTHQESNIFITRNEQYTQYNKWMNNKQNIKYEYIYS